LFEKLAWNNWVWGKVSDYLKRDQKSCKWNTIKLFEELYEDSKKINVSKVEKGELQIWQKIY